MLERIIQNNDKHKHNECLKYVMSNNQFFFRFLLQVGLFFCHLSFSVDGYYNKCRQEPSVGLIALPIKHVSKSPGRLVKLLIIAQSRYKNTCLNLLFHHSVSAPCQKLPETSRSVAKNLFPLCLYRIFLVL